MELAAVVAVEDAVAQDDLGPQQAGEHLLFHAADFAVVLHDGKIGAGVGVEDEALAHGFAAHVGPDALLDQHVGQGAQFLFQLLAAQVAGVLRGSRSPTRSSRSWSLAGRPGR